MGRGRIRMEMIQKEKARKTTFQKRKTGLMKKVYEFSTLCGVDVGVIIHAPKFLAKPEIWPQDSTEVERIIQKFQNTTSDRRPKVYDVKEYYNDKMKKIEGEIAKVHKEKIKVMYPTWDDSYNALGEEQLKMFVSILDGKLDACNQRLNMSKRDLKEKGIVKSDKAETLFPYMVPNLGSHLNFMQNMSQTQLFPLMKSISENNHHVPYYPFQLSQGFQPFMFHLGQNCTQLMDKNAMVDSANEVGVVACDFKMGIVNEDGFEKNQNSLPCYYNGNVQQTQQYNLALQTIYSQLQYDATFQTPGPSPGFELNGLYSSNMFQPQFFNYMHGRK